MNLGIRAFMTAVESLAKTRGIKGAEVKYKVNARGRLVVAVIIPPEFPGQWEER